MSASINDDFAKIIGWGVENRVEINTSKTQCCLVTHEPDGSKMRTVMAGDVNEQTQTLYVFFFLLKCLLVEAEFQSTLGKRILVIFSDFLKNLP